MSLSREDLERHMRHILLKEIGGPGVAKLQNASVSIVGAGALGGPCALYLAAAGIGQIEIWDDDSVDRSNLQRQIQYEDSDIGEAKAESLAARLRALNPGIETIVQPAVFEPGGRLRGDILIDATDNYASRYNLNAIAHGSGRALVHGAAARWGLAKPACLRAAWLKMRPAIAAGFRKSRRKLSIATKSALLVRSREWLERAWRLRQSN